MEKWYKDIYRRNLIDMHINDTDDEYLSNFNAVDYFNYLKGIKKLNHKKREYSFNPFISFNVVKI